MVSNRMLMWTVVVWWVFFDCRPSVAEALMRLNPTTPRDLLAQIYNNALVGNDRLLDIENYMSVGLKSDYRKAMKAKNKGAQCDIPRIMSNGIFAGKLAGFKISDGEEKDGKQEFSVTLNTSAADLSPSSPLRQFDPKIYEVVRFILVKRLLNWKIDNIRASEPDIDHLTRGVNYISLDLRGMLKACFSGS